MWNLPNFTFWCAFNSIFQKCLCHAHSYSSIHHLDSCAVLWNEEYLLSLWYVINTFYYSFVQQFFDGKCHIYHFAIYHNDMFMPFEIYKFVTIFLFVSLCISFKSCVGCFSIVRALFSIVRKVFHLRYFRSFCTRLQCSSSSPSPSRQHRQRRQHKKNTSLEFQHRPAVTAHTCLCSLCVHTIIIYNFD